MPISRLNQPPQFPRIGKLRKGGAKVDAKRPGADLGESFRFVADTAEIQKEFDEIYGTAPKSVMFMFPPHQHIEEVLVCWYEHHLATRLMKRCDGDTQAQWWDAERSKYSFESRPCDGQDGQHCALCRTTAHIKIWIPQLMRRAFIEVPFSSTWDVIHLQQYLGAFAQANGGTLMGIPFVLSRRKMRVAYVDSKTGDSKTGEKWLLHVEPHPSWEKKQVALLLQSLNDAPQIEAPAGSVIVEHDDDDEDQSPPPPPTPAPAPTPKQQATPATIRTYIADVALVSPKFTIKNWHELNAKTCDLATNYGATTDQIEAHRVQPEESSAKAIREHIETLLAICDGSLN